MRALITTDTVGGVWTFTQELAGQLLSRGWSINLVNLGRAPSEPQQRWFEQTASQWSGQFSWAALDVPLEWMEETTAPGPKLRPRWSAWLGNSARNCCTAISCASERFR